MRIIRRALQPVNLDQQQWQRSIINIPLLDEENRQIDGSSGVLTSKQPGQGHSIEFEFKTSVLRPAILTLPLWVSSDARAEILINNQPAYTAHIGAAKDQTPLVHCLKTDVTELTEATETSSLQLRLTYQRQQQGSATIVLDNEGLECKPGVLQEWSRRYAIQPLSFFILAWGSILALAIIILAQINILGDTFKFYAVITTVIVWAAGLLGLPDIARIPLRSMLRRLYSKTRSKRSVPAPSGKSEARPWTAIFGSHRRPLALVLLFLLFVPVSAYAGVIIYCLGVHQYYSSLILRALDEQHREETIRRAFILAPWRKEAQALFEQGAYNSRNNRPVFHQYIKDFVEKEDVRNAALSAPLPDSLPYYLDKSADTAFNDPAIWYASLLPEAEPDPTPQPQDEAKVESNPGPCVTDENETEATPKEKEYASILDARKTPEALINLLALRLLIDINSKHHDDAKRDADQLLVALNMPDNFQRLSRTHTYQWACGILADYYIDEPCSLQDAATWYNNLLDARERAYKSDQGLLWVRPPEKQNLYFMFRSYPGPDTPALPFDTNYGVRNAQCNYLDSQKCKGFKSVFEKQVRDYNPKYLKEETWRLGTYLDKDFKTTVTNTLSKGWRY